MARELSDLEKGFAMVDKLINKARQEKEHKGYRENLGYDQLPKLESYLSNLDITYSDRSIITSAFWSKAKDI